VASTREFCVGQRVIVCRGLMPGDGGPGIPGVVTARHGAERYFVRSEPASFPECWHRVFLEPVPARKRKKKGGPRRDLLFPAPPWRGPVFLRA
jgi:hypothetical protein